MSKVIKSAKKTKTPVKEVEEQSGSEEETKVASKKNVQKTNGKADKHKKSKADSEEEEEKPVKKDKKKDKKSKKSKKEESEEEETPAPMDEAEPEAEAEAEPEEEKAEEEQQEQSYTKKRKADAEAEGDEKRQKSSTIFLGGVASTVTEEAVRELFKECGEITAIRWMNDRETGNFKGCGWVDFDSPEAVEAAMAYNGHELEGRGLRIDVATPRGERTERPAPTQSSNIVFIGGFSGEEDEQTIVNVISEHAQPTTYRLSKDRDTGAFKGFGFFEFETKEQAEQVIEGLNGFEHEGSTLKAEASAPRQGGGGRGGRGGGFGGGRGGGFGGGRGGGFGGGRGGGFGGGRGGGFGGGRGGRGGFGGGGRGGFGGDRGGRGGRGGRGRY